MKSSIRYSEEVRERAVRMVVEHTPDHGSQWAAIRSISQKIGCTAETLQKWVRRVERDEGVRMLRPTNWWMPWKRGPKIIR